MSNGSLTIEIQFLKAQITSLEQLLEVFENTTLEQSDKLYAEIAAHKRAEKQLIEAQEELVRKEKLATLGQLSGSLGHELRNPLGVISNAVYFLQTVIPDTDEPVREYLDLIKREVDNSQRLITDLLDFTRTKTLQTTVVAVDELIKQSLGKCAIQANVTLRLDMPETIPDVKVDPLQLGQVFQNLITNGIQAMPQGGTLRISARKGVGGPAWAGFVPAHGREGQPQGLPLQETAAFVEISITDTGMGISPENMKKLFQPLFTTRAHGIGLGLVVCKNLTEANSGRIEVESELGKGTTFTVILPCAAARRERIFNGGDYE